MKLSNIKTADQLILALAYEGYRKEPAGVGVSANGNYIPPKPGPFYSFGYWAAEQPVPELSIYPQRRYQVEFELFDHGTDLWLSAVIGKTGDINHWELNESYVGSSAICDLIDITTDPESIGEMLQDWHQSLCGSQG